MITDQRQHATLSRAIATEIQVLEHQAPFVLELSPLTAFELIAVLQLVLRHPRLPESIREQAEDFKNGLAQIFAASPACTWAIAQGDDPNEEVESAAADDAPRIIIP